MLADHNIILGVDEVGRGPVAGPVLAAAVLLGKDTDLSLISDSKKLSKLKREKAYEHLIRTCDYAIGASSVKEIEELNILQATMLAMRRAIKLIRQNYSKIVVDGLHSPMPGNNIIITVPKAEDKYYSVAAASIIAKVTRDKLMSKLAQRYPLYGWQQNSGYGTKAHIKSIIENNVSKHHRQSFLGKVIPLIRRGGVKNTSL